MVRGGSAILRCTALGNVVHAELGGTEMITGLEVRRQLPSIGATYSAYVMIRIVFRRQEG